MQGVARTDLNPNPYSSDASPSSSRPSSSGGSRTAVVDMHDPWEMIRKLLVKCETLAEENKKLKKHQASGAAAADSSDELKSQLDSLIKENSNMYLLRDENKSLSEEVDALRAENNVLRMEAARGHVAPSLHHLSASDSGNARSHPSVPVLPAWGIAPLTAADAASLPAYPDVGAPTPRSSEGGSLPSSGRQSSRPSSSRPSSSRSYHDSDRPQTAAERLTQGYLAKLRKQAGLTVSNPNDEFKFEDAEDDEDDEILNLVSFNSVTHV